MEKDRRKSPYAGSPYSVPIPIKTAAPVRKAKSSSALASKNAAPSRSYRAYRQSLSFKPVTGSNSSARGKSGEQGQKGRLGNAKLFAALEALVTEALRCPALHALGEVADKVLVGLERCSADSTAAISTASAVTSFVDAISQVSDDAMFEDSDFGTVISSLERALEAMGHAISNKESSLDRYLKNVAYVAEIATKRVSENMYRGTDYGKEPTSQVLRAATLAGRWRRSALPATLSSVPEEQQLAPAGSLHDPATRGTPERPPHGSASRSKTAVQAIRAAVLSALVPARRPTEAPDGGPSVPDGSTRSAVTIDDVPTRISPLPEDETGDAGASSPHEPAARPLGLPGTAGDTETQPVIAGDTRTPSVIAGDTKTPSVAADDTRTPPDTAGEPPAPAPAASRASHTKLPPVRAHGGPLPADKAHSPKPADSVDPVNPGDRVDPVDIADPVASVAPVDPAVDLLRQSETYTRALIEGAAAAAESLCETLASPAIAGLAAAARHSPATSAAVLLLCTPVPSVEEVMGAVAADAKAKRGEHPREGVEGDVGAEEKAVETETGDAGAEEQDKAKRKEGALSAFGRLLAAVSQGLAGLPPALLARGGRLLEALTEALGKGREQLLAVLQHASDEDMAMLSALGGDIGKAASALAGMCGGDVGEFEVIIRDFQEELQQHDREQRERRALDILAQLEEAVTANDFELASKLLHDSALDPHRFSGQWDGGDALPPDWSLLAIMHRTVAAGDAAAVERLLQLGVPPDFGYGIGSRDGIASAAFAKGVPESAGSRLLWGMSPVHSAAVFDEEGAMLRFLKEGVPLETLLQVAVTGSARKCVSALLREGLGVAVGDCSWEELRETAGRLVKEWGKDRITAMGDLEVAEMEMTPEDIAFFGKAPEDTSVRRKKHIEQLVQWAFGNTDGDTLAGGSVGGSTVRREKSARKAIAPMHGASEATNSMSILMYRLCLCIDQRDFGRMNIALMEAIEINDGERLWDVANMPAAERNGIWPALAALQLAIAHEEVPVAKQLLGLGITPTMHLGDDARASLEMLPLRPSAVGHVSSLLTDAKGCPAVLAAALGRVRICQVILANGHPARELLSSAIRTSNVDTVRFLLESKWRLEVDDVDYVEDLKENEELESVDLGFLGESGMRLNQKELTCLDLPPRGDASQQGQYLIQLLDWGMDKDSMWDDPEHPGHKQPLVSRAIVAGMSQVVTIMAESGADLMLSDTRGRRPYVIALEEAEKGRSECLVTLTSALSSASLASMLGPPSAADGPPPKTRDGLELITLTRLRAVYPPGAAKAMNGLIVSMDRRSIAGVSHQVLADFRPVDVPSGSLSDGIDTIFEQVALDRDTDMAGHPVLSALVELKWIVLCGRWFWTYTFLYALLVLSLINFNIGVANLWAWVSLVLVSLHLAIVFLRMLSSGSYSLEANALLYDIIDTAKVYFNLLRYLKWYGGTLSATAAQRLGHEPHAAKDERRPGAPPETAKKGGVDKRADAVGEAGNGAGLGRGEARADKESKHDSSAWAVLVPNFFVISGYNSFLLAGLAIELAVLCLTLAGTSDRGIMETLHMLGFLCVGIAGAYFLSVSQTLGKFVFALQAIVSNIAVYLGIEVFLILLFAGTLFVTTGTDGAGDLSFWRLCLVGLLLVIGIDDLSIANTSLEELTDGSAAVTVVLLLFQSLQFIVLINILVAMLSGSYEGVQERSTQLFRFARQRSVVEIETLFNFLGSTVGAFRNAKRLGYPPFSLDSAGRDALAEKRGYRGSSWVPLEFYDLPAGHFIVDLDWEDWEALQEE